MGSFQSSSSTGYESSLISDNHRIVQLSTPVRASWAAGLDPRSPVSSEADFSRTPIVAPQYSSVDPRSPGIRTPKEFWTTGPIYGFNKKFIDPRSPVTAQLNYTRTPIVATKQTIHVRFHI